MKLGKRMALLVLGALFFALSPPASAQPAPVPPDPNIHAQPGSVLIFPLFDSNDGKGTLISVTNINTDSGSCDNSYHKGDVCVHYVYVDGENCEEFDRTECLTPGDTLTVVASEHNPHAQEGWLWVEARDPETLEPMKYDYLIGSAIIVESSINFVWSYTPYSFRSEITSCQNGPHSDCWESGGDYCFTDVNPNNNAADFNGLEYQKFPDELVLGNFFEEDSMSDGAWDEVTLMSTELNGETDAHAFVWNNNEEQFSRGFVFTCHTRGPLSLISNVVKDLGGVSGEPIEKFQTGWVRFRSSSAMLGVFKQEFRRNNGSVLEFGAGRELIADGEQTTLIHRF